MFDKAPVHQSGHLDVGGHQIYWEESGAPDGVPALYLHGGPGGGLGKGGYRSAFDPDHFRILALDQRGCGRSRPLVTEPGYDLSENTTAHLLADIEALRQDRGIEAWLVNGVSWGSTLALAYAQQHPERVLGLVLMAVTTTSRFEVDWITETVGAIFPEAWDAFATHAERAGIGYRRGDGRVVEAYRRLLTDADPQVRDAAARAWATWEDTHVSIGTGGVQPTHALAEPTHRLGFATLVTHYWANDAFLDPPILERTDRLAGIPGILIHGRRDVSGPAVTAWRLHRAWPASELLIDEGEGHGGTDMVESWCAANSRLADRLAR